MTVQKHELMTTNLAYLTGARQSLVNIIKNLRFRVEIISIVKHGNGDSYTAWFIVPPGMRFNQADANRLDNG